MLPDQITPQQLEDELDDRLSRLKANEIPEPAVELIDVEGARVESQARGASVLRPNSRQVTDLPFFTPSCQLRYKGVPEGKTQLKTGTARLIKVGDRWRPEGVEGSWKAAHVFESGGGNIRLTLHLPRETTTAVLPPAPTSEEEQRDVFTVPPSATKIRGVGTLKYFTGHTREVSGERLLKRPLADGTLGIRPGGIYAEFLSNEPPEARIGQTWIKVRPRTERPAG